MADSAKLRGWKYDHANGYMEAWDSGTAVARFDASDGLVVLVDSFDLNGQTISSTPAGTSTDLSTWAAAINGASGAADETPAKALCIKVGGTAYYIPAFATV